MPVTGGYVERRRCAAAGSHGQRSCISLTPLYDMYEVGGTGHRWGGSTGLCLVGVRACRGGVGSSGGHLWGHGTPVWALHTPSLHVQTLVVPKTHFFRGDVTSFP